ncbi:inactive peptidyl-prolyl cis-trans isomerase shutdown [Drosophila rhopaloa]|uniref:peptidylprolyl isomerase n=1 Tax=Drosophila rhopaloa TaxID=1041015 RepID=A0A6P4ESM7_DRORH|nr:inactive peptidyl-prolyl cis-trans isomerase shutdown [Drosophila rhopaloa]
MWDMIEQIYLGDATDVDYKAVPSPWTGSLDELRDRMNLIDGHIYKRTTREGHVERDPVPEKVRVSIRYRGYWEGDDAAFQSAKLREFETGGDMVLKGLEAAVRTMRPYEKADFVISKELLFEEMGSSSHIKPKSDGLFQVEVIDYSPIADIEIPMEERDKFHVVYPQAKDLYKKGKIWVKRLRYPNAVTAFQEATKSLKTCRIANADEKRQQTDLLILLSLGLMICYNNRGKPKWSCNVMKDVRRLTGNNPPWRTLFQEGRALAELGEYERALNSYKEALKKQTDNEYIKEEIISITKRITNLQKDRRDLWHRTRNMTDADD